MPIWLENLTEDDQNKVINLLDKYLSRKGGGQKI